MLVGVKNAASGQFYSDLEPVSARMLYHYTTVALDTLCRYMHIFRAERIHVEMSRQCELAVLPRENGLEELGTQQKIRRKMWASFLHAIASGWVALVALLR